MCVKCDGFQERVNFGSVSEYLHMVRELIQVVNEGTLKLVRSDCRLEEMFETPRPGDVISHEFQCTNCGRHFTLSADTYHGGASWMPA